MDIDSSLWIACSAAEAAVIGLLIYRRAWRTFPFFLAYSIWTLTANAAGYAVFGAYGVHSSIYITVYLTNLIVDSVLGFAVLIELGWSVLRPLHSSLPRRFIWIISAFILLVGAITWPFVAVPAVQELSREQALLWHLQQSLAVLRVLVCLALVGGSQLLSIGWRDREIQVATGFGFYSLVGVIIAILHTHQTSRAQYGLLDRFVVASYLCSLVYWVVSFAQKEQERRAMTPQMESMLLAVAGAAHSTRVALGSSHSPDRDRSTRH